MTPVDTAIYNSIKSNQWGKAMSEQPKLKRLKNRRTARRLDHMCTRKVRKEFYKAFRNRLPIGQACTLIGISHRTFTRWMSRGNDPDSPLMYRVFRKNVLNIRRERIEDALKIISKAAAGGHVQREVKVQIGGKYGRTVTRTNKTILPQWNAAAWLLERMHPEEFGIHRTGEDAQSPEETARQIQDALNAMEETVPECCHTEIMDCEDDN